MATLHIEAETCLDARALEEAVVAHLGRQAFVSEGADVLVHARAIVSPEEVTVRLEMMNREGTTLGVRTLRTPGTDCDVLRDDVSLVLALMIDLPREDIELFVPPPAPAPVDVEEDVTRAPSSIHFAASVAAFATHQVLPGFHGGVRLSGELHFDQLAFLELGALLLPPVSVEVGGAGASFMAFGARVLGCVVGAIDWVRIGGCTGIEAGAIHVRGFSLDQSLESMRPLFLVPTLAHMGVLVRPEFEIRIRAGLVFSIVRDRFTYEDVASTVVLHRAELVAPFVEIGAALHFGS